VETSRGDSSARALATRTSPLLWLLGLCLFLPCVKSCGSAISPVGLAAEGPVLLPLMTPFLLAQPLAIVTIVALLRRRAPGRKLSLLATLLVALTLSSPLLLVDIDYCDRGWPLLLVDAALALAALALLVRARRATAWPRHALTLSAFGLASLPLGLFLLDIAGHHAHDLRVGGWLSLVAFLGLPAITLPSLRAITRR